MLVIEPYSLVNKLVKEILEYEYTTTKIIEIQEVLWIRKNNFCLFVFSIDLLKEQWYCMEGITSYGNGYPFNMWRRH